MDLLIVRHAAPATGYDEERREATFGGDPPLSVLGRRQAAAVAERLAGAALTHLYSSPSVRCMETAQAICAAAGHCGRAVPWLEEWGWVWRGWGPAREQTARCFPQVAPAQPPSEAGWGMARGEGDARPEVSRPALRARGEAVVALLEGAHGRAEGDRVALVTSMGFSGAALLPALLGTTREQASFDLDHAAVTEVQCGPARNFIVRANGARHLAGLTAVLCADAGCAHASPHLEDRACRRCGGPVMAKCPWCRSFIAAPVARTCPQCGRGYHGEQAPRT